MFKERGLECRWSRFHFAFDSRFGFKCYLGSDLLLLLQGNAVFHGLNYPNMLDNPLSLIDTATIDKGCRLIHVSDDGWGGLHTVGFFLVPVALFFQFLLIIVYLLHKCPSGARNACLLTKSSRSICIESGTTRVGFALANAICCSLQHRAWCFGGK